MIKQRIDNYKLYDDDFVNLIKALDTTIKENPQIRKPMNLASNGFNGRVMEFEKIVKRVIELSGILGEKPWIIKKPDGRKFFEQHVGKGLSYRANKENANIVDECIKNVFEITFNRLYPRLITYSFIIEGMEISIVGLKELYIILNNQYDNIKYFAEVGGYESAYMAKYILNILYGVLSTKEHISNISISEPKSNTFIDFFFELREITPTKYLILHSVDSIIIPNNDNAHVITTKINKLCEKYGLDFEIEKHESYKLTRNIDRIRLGLKSNQERDKPFGYV